MPIVSIIYLSTHTPAFFWALYAAWIQGVKLRHLRDNRINGNEKLMTMGYFWISVVNAYYMHMLSIEGLFIGQNSGPSYLQIYVIVGLLLGSGGSCTVSWFILSEHALKLINAVKKVDTDGHEFGKMAKKKYPTGALIFG